jgi:hypothetical protein
LTSYLLSCIICTVNNPCAFISHGNLIVNKEKEMVVKYKGREVLSMVASPEPGMVLITVHELGKETVKRSDLNLDNEMSEEQKAAKKAEEAAAEKAAKDAADKAAKAKTPVPPVTKPIMGPVSVKAA